jgi:hypothetical protein
MSGCDEALRRCLHNYVKELMQETIGTQAEGCPAMANSNEGGSAASQCGVCRSLLLMSIFSLKSQHLLLFRRNARTLY